MSRRLGGTCKDRAVQPVLDGCLPARYSLAPRLDKQMRERPEQKGDPENDHDSERQKGDAVGLHVLQPLGSLQTGERKERAREV